MEGAILNLPSDLPALNEATAFNANGKDYATGVSIDLSELTYYPSMPMPQFNNGNGGNIIEITENNSRSTFEELDGNRKDIEYITTPENPAPNPLMRSIVVKNSKGKTRDATTSNIVGYIDVNIPPPNISQTIRNNGYYNFNTDWTVLVEGTEQDHKLDIQVPTSTTTKTITVDTIGNNQSTTYNASSDNVDGYSSVTIINNTSSKLQNKTIECINGLLPTSPITPDSGYNGLSSVNISASNESLTCANVLNIFDLSTLSANNVTINQNIFGLNNVAVLNIFDTFYLTVNRYNSTDLYKAVIPNSGWRDSYSDHGRQWYFWSDIPFCINKLVCDTYFNRIWIKASNDNLNWVDVFPQQDGVTNPTFLNNQLSFKYYQFNFDTRWSLTELRPLQFTYCRNNHVNNNQNVKLENNKQLMLSSNDVNSTVYLTPPTGYDGFTNAIITVPNIHTNPNLYNGYTSNSPLVISNSGTGSINIPSGYDGLGTIYYNITVPQWSPVKYKSMSLFTSSGSKIGTYTLSTTYKSSVYLQEGYVLIAVNPNTNTCFGYKCLATSMTLNLPDGDYKGYVHNPVGGQIATTYTIVSTSGDAIASFNIQSGGSSLDSSSIHSFSIQQFKYNT